MWSNSYHSLIGGHSVFFFFYLEKNGECNILDGYKNDIKNYVACCEVCQQQGLPAALSEDREFQMFP